MKNSKFLIVVFCLVVFVMAGEARATLLFDGSFSPSDHWVNQNYFSSANWGTYACLPRSDSLVVVPAPGGRPGYAGRFTARPGDICNSATSNRLQIQKGLTYYEGQDVWYSISVYIPTGYSVTGWGSMIEERFDYVRMPTKNPDQTDVMTGRAYGILGAVQGVNLDSSIINLFYAPYTGWHDILIHQKWSKTTAGFVEYYYNGIFKGSVTNRVTVPPTSAWTYDWTVGMYEGSANSNSYYLYNMKIGTTRADVEYTGASVPDTTPPIPAACLVFEKWKSVCTLIYQFCVTNDMPNSFCTEQKNQCIQKVDALIAKCRQLF